MDEEQKNGILLSIEEARSGGVSRIRACAMWMNVSKSADILGIDRSTLYDKIKRYELRKPL